MVHQTATGAQHAQAIRDLERITAEIDHDLSGRSASRLFDPNFNPKMHQRANAVMRHLQTSHDLTYVDRKPATQIWRCGCGRDLPQHYDEHNPNMQAHMFLHFISKPNTVYVFRGKTEQFNWLWSMAWPDGRCVVGESAGCTGAYSPNTYFLTLQRGQYLLAWEICGECSTHLEDIAVAGEILAEADARVAFDATAQAAVHKWHAIRAGQEES